MFAFVRLCLSLLAFSRGEPGQAGHQVMPHKMTRPTLGQLSITITTIITITIITTIIVITTMERQHTHPADTTQDDQDHPTINPDPGIPEHIFHESGENKAPSLANQCSVQVRPPSMSWRTRCPFVLDIFCSYIIRGSTRPSYKSMAPGNIF